MKNSMLKFLTGMVCSCVCVHIISCSSSERETPITKAPVVQEENAVAPMSSSKSASIKSINEELEKVKYNYDLQTLETLLSHAEEITPTNEKDKFDLLILKASLHSLLADIYLYNKHPKFEEIAYQVLSLLDEANKLRPDSLLYYVLYAKTCGTLCSIDMLHTVKYGTKSMEFIEKLQKLYPDHPNAKITNAQLYLRKPSFMGGDFKKAKKMFMRLRSEYPDNVEIKIDLARAHLKLGEKKEAKTLLEEIIAAHPRFLPAKKFLETM